MNLDKLLKYISLYLHYLSIPFRILIILLAYIIGVLLIFLINKNSFTKFMIRCWAIITMRMHSFNLIYEKEEILKYEKYMKEEDNVLLIYNHRNLYDSILLLCLCDNITFLLNKAIPSKLPFFKILYDRMNMIYVETDKSNTDSIINYVNNRKKGEKILAIAPDGGKYPENPDVSDISKFKTGAFVGMFPVIPIVIKYNEKNYLDYKIDYPESVLHVMFKGFLNETYDVKVKVLDMVYPDENSSIEEYRDKVYNIMNEEYKKM